MKQCIKCGKIMHDEEIFCSRCGLRWSPEYKNADDEETLPLGAAPMGTGLGDDEETLPLNASQMRQELGDDEETLPLNAYQMRSGTGDDEETLPLFAQTSTMSTAPYSPALDDEETLPLGSANLNEGIGDDEETLPLFAQNDAMSTAPYSPALDDEETLPLGSANLNEGIGDDEETLPLGVEKSDTTPFSSFSESVSADDNAEGHNNAITKILSIIIAILVIAVAVLGHMLSDSYKTIVGLSDEIKGLNDNIDMRDETLLSLEPRYRDLMTGLEVDSHSLKEKGYSVSGKYIVVNNDGITKEIELPSDWENGRSIAVYHMNSDYCSTLSYAETVQNDKIKLSIKPLKYGVDMISIKRSWTEENCYYYIIVASS